MAEFNYRGIGVALVTPFKADGAVDTQALERLVCYLIDGGIDYLVALGTTAESPTLCSEEKALVLKTVKQANDGRLPVVVGIGGNCTYNVIRELHAADLDGVSAVLSITPYYNKPNQTGLYEHFKAIGEASPLPVILYNVPSRTGVNMLPETTLRLARDVKNIVAIKEANGNLDQIDALLANCPNDFSIISGDDMTALHTVTNGGAGVISVVANAIPIAFTAMLREKSAAKWLAMEEFVKVIFEQGSPTGIKAALNSLGLIENRLRLPLVAATDELYRRIATMTRALMQ